MTELPTRQFDPRQYHVLVCMNKEVERSYVTGCLRHNHFQAEPCDSWKTLKAALFQGNPTLVVADYGFDDFVGMSIGCEIYRENVEADLPVVFLLPQRIEITVADGLQGKYINWVHKPFRCAWFCQHLQRVIVQMEESRALKSSALEILSQAPFDCHGNVLMGQALSLVGDAAAVQYYERAVAADPLCSDAYFALGNRYLGNRQLELAATAFERAIHGRAGYAAAYLELGIAKNLLGDTAAARTAWETTLELGDDKVAQRAKWHLQSIDSRPENH